MTVEVPQLSAAERAAQKKRNVWLALALLAFVVLVGVTTVIRIQGTDYSKSDGFYFDGKLQTKSPSKPDDSTP